MLRSILLIGLIIHLSFKGQINYSFSITEMMAEADDCDGDVAGICTLDPQDPVIRIWVYDDVGNTKDTCFIYDDNNNMEFGNWYDLPDINFLAVSNSNANVIYVDLEGFESDQTSNTCISDSGDDNILPQTNVKLIFLSGLPIGTSYVDIASLGGIYQVKFEILKELITSTEQLTVPEIEAVIHPNPINNMGVLSINSTINTLATLKLFSITGEETAYYEEFSITNGINQIPLELSSYANGIYLLNINYKEKSIMLKIMVKH